jgi:hypothetical protein
LRPERKPRKTIQPNPVHTPHQGARGLDGFILGNTDSETPLSLGAETNQHRKRAVKEEEVFDVSKPKLAKDLELNPFGLDVHNVEGVMAGIQECRQGNRRGPRIMRHDRCENALSDIELNPKVSGDSPKVLQCINSMGDLHG